MAGPFDFTGQNIEDTYQRLVQVSGSGFCDGTGSAISIVGSQNLQQVTDQGSVTTNDITVGNLKFTGTEIQNTTNLNNTIEVSSTNINLNSIAGDVVVNSADNTGTSFIVRADGDLNLMYVDGDNLKVGIGTNSPSHKLSVNGNVSASKLIATQVEGFIYEDGGSNSQDGLILWDRDNKRFTATENFKLSDTHLQARTNQITLQAAEAGLTLSGSMNLKGNITASGVIRAFSFVNDSDTTKGLNLRGAGTEITGALDVTQDITSINITASGDISASGTVTTNALVAAGLSYPTTDGDANQIIITDGAGNLTFSTNNSEATHIECKNTSGGFLTKGTPVYITGTVGNSTRLEVAAADASDPAKMPAVGVLEADLFINGEGFVAQGGYLRQLATATIDGTPTNSNDTIYVKAGGGLTMTKPTGSALIQNIAKVARSHASAGSIIVSSILRTNDVPNFITCTQITASGDISASGTITADSFIGIVDGGTF